MPPEQQPLGLLPCPICHTGGLRRAWKDLIISEFMGPTTYELRVSSEKHSLKGSPISVLVCTNCGNIQFFTSPEDFNAER